MKVILTMAVSVNGIIATKDGSEDFLSNENWQQFIKLAKHTGGFVWGRKTYENVVTWDKSYLEPLKGIKKVILSKSDIALHDGFTLAHSPEEALDIFTKEGFKEVIITGGATINSEFAKRGLIDEVILDVNPSIIGESVSIFAPKDFQMKLKFLNAEPLNDDIIKLRY